MSVDYVVDLDCPVKAAFPTMTLIQLVKSRNAASTVLALERDEGNDDPPHTIQIGLLKQTPDGSHMEKVSAQDLLNDSGKLQAYEHYCAGCPANVLREPFGCYGSLAYPIPASVEQWLMDRLPDNLQSTAGWFLQAGTADFGYKGDPIKDMRRHEMFFERRKPVRRTWRLGVFRRWTLTSDQLLEMMIGLGNVQSAHCGMVALFLGVVPHETPIEQVRNHAAWREVFGQARVDTNGSDSPMRQWACFLNALAMAAALDVRLVVDG